MEILTVKANNNSIKYFTFGNGDKPFIIIPGLSLKSVMLSADAVASAYSQFAEEYTVYAFDRAENITNGYTVENMADDTALAMIELGIENAYVFGASQGGMIAQYLAIKYPKLVAKLVLGSSASRLNEISSKVINEWVDYAKNKDVVSLNHSIFTHLYSKEFLDSFGDALYEIEKDGTPDEMERFVLMASACNDFNTYDNLSKIKCPVLVLGAKNDRVLTGTASIEMAEKLGCELYMYDGGHAVYDEAPDYKDRIQNFFK